MRRLDVRIPAPGGHSNGTLHLPDRDGPVAGRAGFPGAAGPQKTFWQMGDRLASMGYVVLIPEANGEPGAVTARPTSRRSASVVALVS